MLHTSHYSCLQHKNSRFMWSRLIVISQLMWSYFVGPKREYYYKYKITSYCYHLLVLSLKLCPKVIKLGASKTQKTKIIHFFCLCLSVFLLNLAHQCLIPSVCLSVYLSFICLSVCLSVFFPKFGLSVAYSHCLSMSIYLLVNLSFCVYLSMSVCLLLLCLSLSYLIITWPSSGIKVNNYFYNLIMLSVPKWSH